MTQNVADLVREGESLLRKGGWLPCTQARAGQTSTMPGSSCWCIDRDDPYAPDAFVTRHGYILEIPHGDLCPPSVLRFPRYRSESGYARAYDRLRQFVERSRLHLAHSDDEIDGRPRWTVSRA